MQCHVCTSSSRWHVLFTSLPSSEFRLNLLDCFINNVALRIYCYDMINYAFIPVWVCCLSVSSWAKTGDGAGSLVSSCAEITQGHFTEKAKLHLKQHSLHFHYKSEPLDTPDYLEITLVWGHLASSVWKLLGPLLTDLSHVYLSRVLW